MSLIDTITAIQEKLGLNAGGKPGRGAIYEVLGKTPAPDIGLDAIVHG